MGREQSYTEDGPMTMAKRISGPLRVERLNNGKRMLLRDLKIDLMVNLDLGSDRYDGFSESEQGTTVVTVPEGFVTDFSSIPGWARWLYRFDSVDLAGCCHDWGYWVGVPRGPADEIWRLVARSGESHEARATGWKARLGWIALRLGGGAAYKDHEVRRAGRNAEA